MTRAAVHRDIATSGLDFLIGAGQVCRAVAYCSLNDLVVRRLLSFHGIYGSLGSKASTGQGN